jgi:hypothetical protein
MSGVLFDALKVYFQEGGWSFEAVPERSLLRMAFQGRSGEWAFFAQAREEQSQLVFYSRVSIPIEERRRMAVAELLTRANYGIIVGNFEIDLRDGEVRYKTSLDIEGGSLTPTLVHNLVGTNVRMMDRYLPGIFAVALEDKDPLEALAEIERPQGPPGEA